MSSPEVRVTENAQRRKQLVLAVRVVASIAGLVWVFSRVRFEDVMHAMQRVSPVGFAFACLTTCANLVLSSIRWRILLAAYGARTLPPLRELVTLNFIGFFYNTCLPGGVGGDVVRGVASRRAFGPEGATRAVAVVFVERVVGLVGLLLVVAAASFLYPLPSEDPRMVTYGSLLGGLAGLAGVGVLAVGARLAPQAPAPLRRVLEKFPPITNKGAFALGILLSLGTQSLVVVTGHAIVGSLSSVVALRHSFVVVPLAMATAFLPFLVGGTGAREAVFSQLYSSVGMPAADASAAGFVVFLSQVLVALTGAFLPLPKTPAADATSEAADGALPERASQS